MPKAKKRAAPKGPTARRKYKDRPSNSMLKELADRPVAPKFREYADFNEGKWENPYPLVTISLIVHELAAPRLRDRFVCERRTNGML